ncbi:MAG: hypothetical protein WDN76_11910 [Alphaproteobacteria bacterium]
MLKLNAQTHSPDMLEKLKHDFIAGWGGYRLQGAKERIVDDLIMLVEAGVDGVLLSWPNYLSGMERFRDEVHPLLVEAGLR